VLKTDLNKISEQNKEINGQIIGGVKILGNLPYYITTPIIMKILEDRVAADSITVMLQKEVADRIQAGPGSKTYGALSVAVQYYCTVTHVANAPKEVFIPRPKVDSTVIRLDIRKEKPVQLYDEDVFFAIVKSGFGQRRKTLLNSLTGIYGLTKDEVASIINIAGIDPGRRAETLNIQEFATLANTMKPRN
ncbi:MAG: rRNA adenine dimethyltransferase family protein, partial [Eubacteriales bacterium]|nr:rRNA adenine dimethyltransferase family protein [Eubacteriales bacterium]